MASNDRGIDLRHVMKLPPPEAVDYFEQKGVTVADDWRRMSEEARENAFTVSGVAKLEVLQTIRDEMLESIAGNVPLPEFSKKIIPILQQNGWWGDTVDEETGEITRHGNPFRLRLIYQQNLQSSFMAGRRARQRESAGEYPYWIYVSVADSRTRPHHLTLHGRVFRHDDPFYQYFYPPNGFLCRCRVRAMPESRVGAGKGRFPLSDSRDRLSVIKVPVSKEKPELGVAKVGRFEHAPGKYLETDPGFAQPPGKRWSPNLDKYDDALVRRYLNDIANQ